MAIARHDLSSRPAPEVELRDDDRHLAYDDGGGRSNFTAFLLGGVVVAGGLLAFLYYDADGLNRDDLTTGSLPRIELQGPMPSPNIIVPAQPQPAR